MTRILWLGALLVLLALCLPTPAWALRCGGSIVSQGDSMAAVRNKCGAPFFVDHFVRSPGVGVNTPVARGTVVTGQAWYYNFGPQRLMVRLDFSGGVLAREQTLGYGFVGHGGPCDFTSITAGISVADLIARCGMPAQRSRNPLATAVGMGAVAPAWAETWFYVAPGSGVTHEVWLQDGRVTEVRSRQ